VGPLLRGLLELGREAARERVAETPPPDAQTLLQLDRIAGEVRAGLGRGRHPVDALNQAVFRRRGFRKELRDLSLESALLHRVLHNRRGSCMGLSALYLALGDRLDLPLAAVLVPGHLFVRVRGGGPPLECGPSARDKHCARGKRGKRDVELLEQGRQQPRSWYAERYDLPRSNPLYFETTLDVRQTLAVFRYNLANDLRDRQRLRGALHHYRQVVAVLPRFAEAQANLGLTLHRLGRLEQARRAYLAARAANPGLPNLEQNLEALERERGR